METLDLDQLRTLAAIASQESFAGAAVQLGRTQSAVTQQMQKLEERIGHALFEKQGRQKRLTDHGQRLLGYARHILAIHDEALSSLQHRHVQGLVRIGAPHDVSDTMLPMVLQEIALKHGKTVGQVTLRWLVQQGNVAAIPKAGSEKHLKENFAIFDFRLGDDDMKRIHALARPDGRMISPEWAPSWDKAA